MRVIRSGRPLCHVLSGLLLWVRLWVGQRRAADCRVGSTDGGGHSIRRHVLIADNSLLHRLLVSTRNPSKQSHSRL